MEILVHNPHVEEDKGIIRKRGSKTSKYDEEQGTVISQRETETITETPDRVQSQEEHERHNEYNQQIHGDRCGCEHCVKEHEDTKKTIENLSKNVESLKAHSVDLLYKHLPNVAKFMFGGGVEDLTVSIWLRKFFKSATWVITAVATIVILILLYIYVRRFVSPPIVYSVLPTDGRNIHIRRWDMAPCRRINKVELDLGKITIISNKTHVIYVEIPTLIQSQEGILQEEGEWTDVICASMLGPSNNISMPCSCSILTPNGIISGFNMLPLEISSAKISIIEKVPVMGHSDGVSRTIPKNITLTYYDAISVHGGMKKIVMHDEWVSTALRGLALMNDVELTKV